jgi:hypothetical protein
MNGPGSFKKNRSIKITVVLEICLNIVPSYAAAIYNSVVLPINRGIDRLAPISAQRAERSERLGPD